MSVYIARLIGYRSPHQRNEPKLALLYSIYGEQSVQLLSRLASYYQNADYQYVSSGIYLQTRYTDLQ